MDGTSRFRVSWHRSVNPDYTLDYIAKTMTHRIIYVRESALIVHSQDGMALTKTQISTA